MEKTFDNNAVDTKEGKLILISLSYHIIMIELKIGKITRELLQLV